MTLAITIILALLLDRILGEPRQHHPLVYFGNLASRLEALANPPKNQPANRFQGILCVALLTLVPALLVGSLMHLLAPLPAIVFLLELFGLYFCLGRQSLAEHAQAVATPLGQGDLQKARKKVAMIVSRDADSMDPQQITKATVETVLENANDACFATLFWFAIGGLPLALLHRFSNTLDAMWGYKTPRFLSFGWAAARLDDLLNWIPARLGATALAIVGQTRRAIQCWRSQAHHYDSPNGGVIMSTGAGALGIRLGGQAVYHGQIKERPLLGDGRQAQYQDIQRSIDLVDQGVFIWVVFLLMLALIA